MRDDRLKEAGQTGADRLVTVCHYCGQTFGQEEELFNFKVTNYANMVAEAKGIQRDDTLKNMLSGEIWIVFYVIRMNIFKNLLLKKKKSSRSYKQFSPVRYNTSPVG